MSAARAEPWAVRPAGTESSRFGQPQFGISFCGSILLEMCSHGYVGSGEAPVHPGPHGGRRPGTAAHNRPARQGHEVFIARSEEQAKRTLLVHASDVILVDTSLAGDDGYEVADRLCVPMRTRPVLVGMTGYNPSAERLRTYQFDHHVQKPVDVNSLTDYLSAPTATCRHQPIALPANHPNSEWV